MPSLTNLAGRWIAALPGGSRLLRRAAGEADGGAAPIFMLHRVLPGPWSCYEPEMVVSLAAFEALLYWIAGHYQVVRLDDLQLHLEGGVRPGTRPACALTFDDGWADTFIHAFPVLQRMGMPATVFLPLHFIGTGQRFWQERLFYHLRRLRGEFAPLERLRAVGEAFPWCPRFEAADLAFGAMRGQLLRRSSAEADTLVERLGQDVGPSLELAGRAFMNWDEVRTMQAAGMAFGSHTLRHTLIGGTAPASALAEMRVSRLALGEQLGAEVKAFSYPWGSLSPFAPSQARAAGYACAVTTRPGLARAGGDPWRWPRLALSDAQLGWIPARPGPAAVPKRSAAALASAPLQASMARARWHGRRSGAEPLQRGGVHRDKLRIGYVVDNPEAWEDSPRENLGGSELQLRRMIEALDPQYFAPELYFLRSPKAGMPRQLPCAGFAGAEPGAGRWAMGRGLYRLLRRRRPAIVQTMFVDGMFLGVPAAWAARVPAILCARRNAGHWRRWRHRWSLPIVNRMADAWQCNSRSVAAVLRLEGGITPAAIEIVPNWVDLERFTPAAAGARLAARRRLGVPELAFVAVCVANYTPVKDHATLIAAAAAVCARLPAAQFIFLGEGPERERLAAAIAGYGLGRRIHLAGSHPLVETYLAAADVGVLSSRSEGCSNAVLEYMAAGLATVLSDLPANRALTDAGLFPVGDAKAASTALLEVACEPARRERQGRANRRQAERFGGAAFAERLQAHYLRVAGGGG